MPAITEAGNYMDWFDEVLESAVTVETACRLARPPTGSFEEVALRSGRMW
jgi:hypothetical protein